jgi:hypothetical protein
MNRRKNVKNYGASKDVKPKHAGGRPRRFSSPHEMKIAVEDYFAKNKKYTMCGLAMSLGFLERTNLYDYAGYGEEFLHIIKKARVRVEEYYEKNLVGRVKPTGSIFALKNMKWRDSHDVTTDGDKLKNVTIIEFGGE